MEPRLAVLIALCVSAALCGSVRAESLVHNGSFDLVGADGSLDGWAAAGLPAIEQRVTSAVDPERGKVAQLTCTRFVPGSPASHAMIAQERRVGVRRGQWYRLRFLSRGADIGAGAVHVALSNTRDWSNTGLYGSFLPSAKWEPQEFIFQATQDLRPEDSRLQIWFGSTGSLWLDDVDMQVMTDFSRQWQPALPVAGVRNAVPNSSFECGGSGWGCWAPGIPGWGAQLFQLLGEWDTSRAYHGRACWKLSLSPEALPVAYFDYFNPVQAPVRTVLLGHEGWVPVEPGRAYVVSAYVQADRAGLPVRVSVREAEGPWHSEVFPVGTEWQRVQVTFVPEKRFACAFVGPDLSEVARPEGTVWVDAVQFEPGTQATAYAVRSDVETFVGTDRVGNVFTDPSAGLSFRVRSFNASPAEKQLRGVLTVTDFRDRVVWRSEPQVAVGGRAAAETAFERVLEGRKGFFRVRWEPEGGLAQQLRCAVIEPSPERDSAFGMNHAFSWEFLLRLSQAAGLRWWRDWSVKWQTVQPAPDGFDFRVPDAQIQRVLDADGRVLVLLPFPSADWAAKADAAKLAAEAGSNDYLRQRLPAAFKPQRMEDFARYVQAAVQHYGAHIKCFEVLNEPLYTNYALPARFGYSTADYVEVLRAAYEAAKAADPGCTVVGGISGPPDMEWTKDFVRQGGLRWCDVMNCHIYPHKGYPEAYEESFRVCEEEMRARGEAKPIWMTEFGVYADDDPPFSPYQVGDGTMTEAMRSSELAASGDIVRFAAVLFAHGVRKVFYHAGTCSALHDSSAENMFFEYGGSPLKQYAAQAALSRLMGPDVEFVRKWQEPSWLQAYEFRSRGRNVVLLWTRRADAPPLPVPDGYNALDLMGNVLPERQVMADDVPIYFVGR